MKLWPALAADGICILVFALVGRSSHGESIDLLGVLRTAGPFLAGYLVGLALSRGWRHPLARGTALTLWLSTVAGGMLLRWATDAGVQTSFVIVTAVVLAAKLLGWRAVTTLAHRARRPATR